MLNLRKILTTWAMQALHGKLAPKRLELGYVAAEEIRLINGLFQQLKIKAVVDHANIVASDTGDFIRYPLRTYGKISALESIETDLEVALSMHRGREVEVNIRTPMLAIEVAYPLTTRPLLWADAKLHQLKPFQALLGMDYTSMNPAPAILDYGRKTIAHTLIAGATGSGKSVLVIGLINSLCRSTSPEQLSILFLDPKFDPDWKILVELPHVTMWSEPADCVVAIASVKAELERRKRHADQRKLILIIDEYADFRGDLDKETREKIEQQIVSITSVGRSLGIHVILITQKPTVEIIDTVAKGNLTTRACGIVTTAKESEIGMGSGGIGCEALTSAGSFYITIGGGRVQRIQSYLIEGEVLEAAIDATIECWAAKDPYQIEMVAADEIPAIVQQREDDLNAERILEHYSYEELFDDAGAIRPGMQLEAIRKLFGDDVTNAGTPRRVTVKALDRIKQMQS